MTVSLSKELEHAQKYNNNKNLLCLLYSEDEEIKVDCYCI